MLWPCFSAYAYDPRALKADSDSDSDSDLPEDLQDTGLPLGRQYF